MLVQKSCQKKIKSLYKCDRCGRIMNVNRKFGIFVQKYLSNPEKCYDLCIYCFKAMQRGIEKGVNNARNKSIEN